MSTNLATAYCILVKKKNINQCDYPHVSDLLGLLLFVVLAVHSVIDHQTTMSKKHACGVSKKRTFNEHQNAPV